MNTIKGMLAGTVMAAVALAAACGGSTAGGSSARADLEANAPERCAAACKVLVPCDLLGGSSCDSVGCACAPGEAGCECPVPQCTTPTEASCSSDCQDGVTEVLQESPGCEPQYLAVLQCFAGATCPAAGQPKPCNTQTDAFEACNRAVRNGDGGDKPTTGGVTCQSGGGSAGVAEPGGPLPPPGSVVCQSSWGSCSDRNQYDFQCIQGADGTLTCQCIVGGALESTLANGQCFTSASDVNGACGWGLAYR